MNYENKNKIFIKIYLQRKDRSSTRPKGSERDEEAVVDSIGDVGDFDSDTSNAPQGSSRVSPKLQITPLTTTNTLTHLQKTVFTRGIDEEVQRKGDTGNRIHINFYKYKQLTQF